MTTSQPQEAPYGSHRVSRFVETLRALGSRAPDNGVGRRVASLLRRACFAAGPAPYDVEAFPSVHVRLRPATNRTEKRAFLAVHLWDTRERAALETALLAADASTPFTFVDVGANVGLYGLSLVAAARRANRRLHVLAIEPDTINRGRLAFNVAASGADVMIEAAAVGRVPGQARLVQDARNRGETRIGHGSDEGVLVEVRTLASILAGHGITAVDAMKVDVEGMDFDVLAGLFEQAPPSLWPRTLVVEAGRTAAEAAPLIDLLAANGYHLAERTRLNVVAVRG